VESNPYFCNKDAPSDNSSNINKNSHSNTNSYNIHNESKLENHPFDENKRDITNISSKTTMNLVVT